MSEDKTTTCDHQPSGDISRRRFLGSVTATAASASFLATAPSGAAEKPVAPEPAGRKIKLGWIGCGGRGAWLAKLFQDHGGYEIHAVADYFPDLVDKCGDALGVEKSRRFTGLSGHKKVLDCGVEALGILDVPCFFPEQATAAVAAGCHVYIAKPIAVDAPGCLAIEAAGKLATQKQRCFLADYQLPTDPVNIEVAQRIWDGGLGRLWAVTTIGQGGGANQLPDPPKGKTIESRLRGLIWCADIPLGGDPIVNYDIHIIDAAVWAIRRRPISAVGYSRVCRPEPHGDRQDLAFITYECPEGLLWNHQTMVLPDHGQETLACNIHGQLASARIGYDGKSFLRGGPKHFGGGTVDDLYKKGAMRNIATFYQSIVEQRFDNPTVQRAVDGTLTAILGREAAMRGVRLTMDELLKENRKLEVDLTGLTV
jgi:predicted dehydrogenase